jgi:hypothetical protein
MNTNTIEKWDERATSFYKGQLEDTNYYPQEIVKCLKEKGFLTGKESALEIGSGSGR